MYYFYVLKGKKNHVLYFGFCRDLRRRFLQHNSGLVKSTRVHRPFALVYYEAYISEEDAKHREYGIKLRANAYRQLKRRIKNCVAEAE